MKKRVAGLILTGVAAAGLGLGAAGVAFADPSATPSASPTTQATAGTSSGTGQDNPGRGHHRGERQGELAKQLAAKLGVDETKVTEALQSLRTEQRAQARAQRDQAPQGTQGDQGSPGTGQKPDRTARDAELAKGLAQKLGVDEAKVTQALSDIRTAHQAEHKAAFSTRLDQAVTDGKITRAEADAVLKAAEAGVIGMGGPGR